MINLNVIASNEWTKFAIQFDSDYEWRYVATIA